MLEGLFAQDLRRPGPAEAFSGSFSQSLQSSEKTLSAVLAGGDDDDERATRVTLSERALSSVRKSEISYARSRGEAEAAEDFSRGVDRAARRIGRALDKFVRRVERLQDRAEAIGERLSERLLEDIQAGRFDDRTPRRIASKLLRQAGKIDRAAERLTDRINDAVAKFGGAGEAGSTAFALEFSQSISLSVRQVQVEIQDGDKSISVSFQRIVFESTTSLGLSFAQATPEVVDGSGQALPTESLESGVYANAETEGGAQIAALAGGEAPPAEAPQGALVAPGVTAGQGALLLLQSLEVEASSTRFRFDAASRLGSFSGEYQARSFSFEQSSRLLALTV